MWLFEKVWGVEVWDGQEMSALAPLLPDENGNLRSILSWRARDVRRRFGMSVLSVSSCACFWGSVASGSVAGLEAKTHKQVLNAACGVVQEPMAFCVRAAHAAGEALDFVVSPNVWLTSLVKDA